MSGKFDKFESAEHSVRVKGYAINPRFMSWLMGFALLFLLPTTFSLAFANTSIQSPVWQQTQQTLPKSVGVFNAHLREAVRSQLTLPDIPDLNTLSAKETELIARLQVLDKGLFRYIRVSESTTRFEQLKHLMPALYNIEEQKLITQLLNNQNVKVPRLRNARLLSLLDKRISRLANGLIFNMKSLVRERRDYEPNLLEAMADNGIRFSARPPDFILDYSLMPNGKDDQELWVFKANIALLNTFEIPIVAVNDLFSEAATTQEQAELKGVALLAELVTDQLKTFLINSVKQ